MGRRSPNLRKLAVPDSSTQCESHKVSQWWLWSTVALTLVGAALRFNALDAKTLWVDEVFSLWMASHEPFALFQWLKYIDHHPPLYYLLLHTWVQWLGDSPNDLRSLSAFASTLAIPFYAGAARRLSGNTVAIVATLLLVISPFHIRYAQETRMYGVLTLAVAILFFSLSYLLTERSEGRFPQWWAWIGVVTAEAAAMLTHNTATILVPLALNGAIGGLWLAKLWGWEAKELVALNRPNFLRWWLLSQVGALLLWSPWATGFVLQVMVVDSDFWIEPPTLWSVWLALGSLSHAYLPDWFTQRDYVTWVVVGLVIVGIGAWQRGREVTWFLGALWLLPPVIELLASLRRPLFYDRTLIWTTLPYFLLVARGIILPNGARAWLHWGWLGITLTVVFLLNGLGVSNYYQNFEKEAWDEVARFVADEAEPNELVLFHASWAQLPFDYYYERALADEAPPLAYHGVPVDLFDAGALEPPMTEADVSRVLGLIEGRDRLWLVYSHWWYTDPNGLLLRFLDEQFEVVEQREWPGIRVVEYRRE